MARGEKASEPDAISGRLYDGTMALAAKGTSVVLLRDRSVAILAVSTMPKSMLPVRIWSMTSTWARSDSATRMVLPVGS
jgi:hypothetical protein